MKPATLVLLVGIVISWMSVANCAKAWTKAPVDVYEISAQDIPSVFARLNALGKDETFTVFVFSPGSGPFNPDDALNLQFYVEEGRIGFDWVLLGLPNIRDREKYERLAASLGYKVVPKNKNGVNYLRTEEGDLPRLCEHVLYDLYGKKADSRIGLLILQGMPWPK
ncbi:MAG TPA: hypothetical protein VNV15_06445 [Opitutaceae bacterium]|jgi:hypothetical protein|nr:hypothetical protein [Opitutaceae bacterium]